MKRRPETAVFVVAYMVLAACGTAGEPVAAEVVAQEPAPSAPVVSGEPGGRTGDRPAGHAGAGVAMGSSYAAAAKTGDVSIERCALNRSGATEVEANITNPGAVPVTYVATVAIRQDGRRVDGVGLIATGLEPGRSARVAETGVRAGLTGEVACAVVDVSAIRR